MTQTERREYLIGELIKENTEYKQLTISQIPQDEKAQMQVKRILDRRFAAHGYKHT